MSEVGGGEKGLNADMPPRDTGMKYTKQPGMKVAAIAISPVFGGKPKSLDEAAARAVKGVRQVVRVDEAVATGPRSLLPRNRSPSSLHEGLDLVQGEAAIFVGVHSLEDPLVSRLKLLQRDGPVTITVHQSEKHTHHHAGTHTPGTHHTSLAHHAGAHGSLPIQLLLLVQDWWLLLHHLPLLGTRSDSATRQNESRRREHQNVLLHFKSPQRRTPLGAIFHASRNEL
jgi:hypothetical protein